MTPSVAWLVALPWWSLGPFCPLPHTALSFLLLSDGVGFDRRGLLSSQNLRKKSAKGKRMVRQGAWGLSSVTEISSFPPAVLFFLGPENSAMSWLGVCVQIDILSFSVLYLKHSSKGRNLLSFSSVLL